MSGAFPTLHALALAAGLLTLTQCTTMAKRSQPPRLAAAEWQAGDTKTLPFQRWPENDEARARPAAILLCVHGLSGAASDFWPLGQELPERGIVVYGLQLRGQGNDPDRPCRGDIFSAGEWQRDLREFSALLRARHPGVPLFWLGESLGSLITLHTAAETDIPAGQRPDGLILLSPAVALRQRLPAWKTCLIRLASRIAPAKRLPLGDLDNKRVAGMHITRDATHASQAPKTPHLVPGQSLRLLREMDRLMRASTKAARQLTSPVLVLYTPNDPVVTQPQIETWFGHLAASDKTRRLFPKDYHLILHDDDRWQAVTEIGDWLLHRGRGSAAPSSDQ